MAPARALPGAGLGRGPRPGWRGDAPPNSELRPVSGVPGSPPPALTCPRSRTRIRTTRNGGRAAGRVLHGLVPVPRAPLGVLQAGWQMLVIFKHFCKPTTKLH